MKQDIKSMRLPELEGYFESIGEQKFRAKQIFSWLHKTVLSFDEMTDISIGLREKLDKMFYISVPALVEKQESKIDGTIKYLWSVQDKNLIESVLMKYSHGNTVCLSTQVGCRMGCNFCASSLDGFVRNLSASEMLDQVLFTKTKVSNVVLMGTGEPLDNFDNVIRFIHLINHPSGINLGARHITLSTCGIVENIDRLADYDVQLTLAISLHAPDDETRTMLIPANRNTGVKALMEACENYFERTGRRITYEYSLIDGINDSPGQAIQLSRLLKKTSSHLNLIFLNNVYGRRFKPSTEENIKIFIDILNKNGVNYTIRRSLGSDIEASCGQLRHRIISTLS